MIFSLITLIIVFILLILAVSRWKVHPFIALILAAIGLGLCLGLGGTKTVEVLLQGFSDTLKWIAIVVILGAFIGEVLQETGGAFRISDTVIRWVGERKLPWAMGIIGYIISIPVFVDVAYIVLQPVTEALAVRIKKPILVVGLALAAGLTVSHTLIPPTPGPLAVVSLLDAQIGRLLFINAFVGAFAMVGGIIWASYFCKNFRIPYDDELLKRSEFTSDQEKFLSKKQSVLLDLAPILVPIFLMAFGAFFPKEEDIIGSILSLISTPVIAVLIGAAIAWLQVNKASQKASESQLVERAITKSALVIMITGAGGAFGYVIRESGMPDGLVGFFSDLPFLGFLLPFLIAALLTSVTGSITISLIGSASIVGPMATSLPYSAEMMAALIGCGSFCVFHANASFFWLLNRLHKVPVHTLYNTYTIQSLVMGISGLIGVAILWILGIH
ncbi:MAG: GntP family permease [Saprospiraceae bacterium]|nr:GntP family permease [Saprospiraceae bacterium]